MIIEKKSKRKKTVRKKMPKQVTRKSRNKKSKCFTWIKICLFLNSGIFGFCMGTYISVNSAEKERYEQLLEHIQLANEKLDNNQFINAIDSTKQALDVAIEKAYIAEFANKMYLIAVALITMLSVGMAIFFILKLLESSNE